MAQILMCRQPCKSIKPSVPPNPYRGSLSRDNTAGGGGVCGGDAEGENRGCVYLV